MVISKKNMTLSGVLAIGVAASVGVATDVIPLPSFLSQQANVDDAKKVTAQTEAKVETKIETIAPKPVEPAKSADVKVPVKVEEQAPAFDILRVEKDGSILAAGRAKPNAKVELVAPDGKVIAETKADTSGDFVLLPEKLIPSGDHVLNLRSQDETGKRVVSPETGVVHIPKDGKEEVLAMVTKKGAASRILVKPERFTLKVEKSVEEAEKPAVSKPAKIKADDQSKVVEQPRKPDEVKVANVEPAPKADAKKETPKIAVEAVEVEDGNIYVAGSAKAGSPVQVYIDNKQLGLTKGTSKDRFLLEKKYDLSPGKHSVRADVLSGTDGKVVARAEVPLVHEPQLEAKAVEVPPTARQIVVSKPAIKQSEIKTVLNQPNTHMSEPQGVIRTGSAVIIRRRDNLWRISTKTYGKGYRYTTIFDANRDQIRNPHLIYPGQIFKLPEKKFN